MQAFCNRAYLVAQVEVDGSRFVSRAVVTADSPEGAVSKLREFLARRGDLSAESRDFQAIEFGDVPDGHESDAPLLLKFGDEFQW